MHKRHVRVRSIALFFALGKSPVGQMTFACRIGQRCGRASRCYCVRKRGGAVALGTECVNS